MKQRERECHDKAIYPTRPRKRNFKRIACYALFGAATALITVPGTANATPDNKGVFFKLNNPGDPNFNQLLGINDNEIIAGYFGDGMASARQQWVRSSAEHALFSRELRGDAAGGPCTITQTQAIGINNERTCPRHRRVLGGSKRPSVWL